jgi:cytochrome c5
MKKFAAAALMLLASAAYADRPASELYPRACSVCHVAGVGGAPKTHDVAAWKTRMDAKGMDALVLSVTNGLNAMPPRGMCMDCTPGEYKALIEFMMSPAP